MEIALIGLPQSGKTTLLNALTMGRAEAGVWGGSREEVRAGVTKVPDPRLDTLAELFRPDKTVPVEIKYWDVPSSYDAGEDGPGIGGKFLNLLQNAGALLHVVRAFEDPAVAHISGSVDPHRDAGNMLAELVSSDLAILDRRVQRIEANLKGASGHERDTLLREASFLQRLKEGLQRDIPVRGQEMLPDEVAMLSNYQLLTNKPLLTVLNVDEAALSGVAGLEEELAKRHSGTGTRATALCGKLEMELAELSAEDEREFRESMGLGESGLDQVVRLSYDLLSLISFFTYVSREVRAWTVPADTPAVKAAGKIHSDIERGFIRAEVVGFEELARCGSVAQCKSQGLLHLEGKTYSVKDGDVITFLFNV